MNKLIRAGQASLILGATLLAASSWAQDDIDLTNEDNRVAYAIGTNVGQSLVGQGLLEDIDNSIFLAGVRDTLDGEAKLSQEEIMTTLQDFQQRIQDEAQAASMASLAESEKFLAENENKEGVVVLDSGLQYQILTSGPDGGASPTRTSSVLAHYHGTLTDGSVFDSSVDRGEPASFGVSQVIAGWTEALQLMKVGDKWRLFIPPAMAYGESSPTPSIPPNSALIFDVELLEVN